jgi:autophagy-related protein 5
MECGKVSGTVRYLRVEIALPACANAVSCNADNFEEFWRIASKVFPAPTLPWTSSSPNQHEPHPRSQSTDPGGSHDKDSAYTVRNVPVRIHLPDGPVLQDIVPPLGEDGNVACALIEEV